MNLKELIKEVEKCLRGIKYSNYRDYLIKLQGIKQTVEAVDKTKGFFMDSDYKQLHKDWPKLKKLLNLK